MFDTNIDWPVCYHPSLALQKQYLPMKKPTLVLASSSSARRSIMNKLSIPYKLATPNIDETPYVDEPAAALVKRLSLAKAHAVAAKFPDALVVGCDLVAALGNHIIGKPLYETAACEQLRLQSNREIVFYSGMCLLNTRTLQPHLAVDEISVKFRKLSEQDIINYIQRDQPLDCAGSFKCESLGMTLVEWARCDDFNALVGLSLVTLTRLLLDENINLLAMIT